MSFEVITTAETSARGIFNRQSADYPSLDEAKAALEKSPEEHRVGIWSRETGRCVWPEDKAEQNAELADSAHEIQQRDERLQSPASKAAREATRQPTAQSGQGVNQNESASSAPASSAPASA